MSFVYVHIVHERIFQSRSHLIDVGVASGGMTGLIDTTKTDEKGPAG